jgi:hypothetical protein
MRKKQRYPDNDRGARAGLRATPYAFIHSRYPENRTVYLLLVNLPLLASFSVLNSKLKNCLKMNLISL